MASFGFESVKTTRITKYVPMSRIHLLRVTTGKSDQETLSRAKARNKISGKLFEQNLSHRKERDTKTAIAESISSTYIEASVVLPSSIDWAIEDDPIFSHCEGNLDPTMTIQTIGIHKEIENLPSLAGSRTRSQVTSIIQTQTAINGGIQDLPVHFIKVNSMFMYSDPLVPRLLGELREMEYQRSVSRPPQHSCLYCERAITTRVVSRTPHRS
jgi:hypothetical protein